jgi:hypothetical protein
LDGGISTYNYSALNPLNHFDPTGEAYIDASCWANRSRLLDAEEKVRKVLEKSCADCSGPSGCVSCEEARKLSEKLKTVVVSCKASPTPPRSIRCAEAEVGGNSITFFDLGFGRRRCGCVASTFFHELQHSAGAGGGQAEHANVNDTERRCFPCSVR